MSIELRKNITNLIIKNLESSDLPCWRKPWKNDPNCGVPTSFATDKPYRGINILLLQIASMIHNFDGKWWGTFNQWKKSGANVKPRPKNVKAGEWGTTIVLFKPFKKEEIVKDKKGNEELVEVTKFFMTSWTVFNIDQVDGKSVDKYRPDKTSDIYEIRNAADCEKAEKVIAATGADIRYGGNKACYFAPKPLDSWPKHKDGDYIKTPSISNYTDIFNYYETLFHELAHWSEVRVGWKRTDEKYAEGELIAEMASCFLANECGIPLGDDLENHAAYLKGWLSKMKQDSGFIFRASAQASKVCDYIMSCDKSKKKAA